MKFLILLIMASNVFAQPITKFGCNLGDVNCTLKSYDLCTPKPVVWPNNNKTAPLPVGFVNWRGPYLSRSGYDNVQLVNSFFTSGKSAGLGKEKFRSFDAQIDQNKQIYKAHSSIMQAHFPQIEMLPEVPYSDRTCFIEFNTGSKKYENRCTMAMSEPPKVKEYCNLFFDPAVNYAVRSLGVNSARYGSTLNIYDSYEKERIRGRYYKSLINPEITPPTYSDILIRRNGDSNESQDLYREFYENNLLFVTPAIRSYSQGDIFTVLSPFTLQSNGASTTDSQMLYAILQASASIPKDLKLRIMNQRMLVPTLMQIFKSTYTTDYSSPEAHNVAYNLFDEAKDVIAIPTTTPRQTKEQAYAAAPINPTPYLNAIVKKASELTHIPPVARMKITNVNWSSTKTYYKEPYYNDNTYGFNAVLRQGETIELTVDLKDSWVDRHLNDCRMNVAFNSVVLRGAGTIEKLNPEGSLLKITIPFMVKPSKVDTRTDILLYTNDGVYNSAPAYISVKHIQAVEESMYFQ